MDLFGDDFSGLSGSGWFSMGSAEFVIRELGTTTLSFYLAFAGGDG